MNGSTSLTACASSTNFFTKNNTLVPLQTSHDNMTRDVELEFMNRYYSTGEPCRYTVIRGDYNKVIYLAYFEALELPRIPMIAFLALA